MGANPFRDALRYGNAAPPCAVVIFGANGDLTKRKLIPSLYRLVYERKLPSGVAIIGNSRSPLSDDDYREKMREAVNEFLTGIEIDQDVWNIFARGLFYVAGDVGDPETFARLGRKLEEIEKQFETHGNALFYLATQPSQYATVAGGLGRAGLARANGWRRLVVEKPFGRDLESARELNHQLHAVFDESAIYRIDHYLGKETVQNIFAFRFGNLIFEPLWNRHYISNVQITAAESIGVEGRGAYYQEAGALRDMIQSHLLQLMATIAMEPPGAFEASGIRDERAKLLRDVHLMDESEVTANTVAGQYGPARAGGKDVPGFRQEPGVAADSRTDTFAAATFFVENWRWAGVPFYLRTGKRMPRRVTDIAIQFYKAPKSALAPSPQARLLDSESESGSAPSEFHPGDLLPDLLLIRIQPEEGLSLRFLSKVPGTRMALRPVSMDFDYGASFGSREPSDYETLLTDALNGDPMLYTRQDAVEASWRIVDPILCTWENQKFDFPNYAAGSWGPKAADEMLARRGHTWRNP